MLNCMIDSTEHRRLAASRARKKVLALSIREAMQQRVATLQAGHVTTGIDAGLRGGHSTDVLQEASLYQAREEYTTLCDRMKLLCFLVCYSCST